MATERVIDLTEGERLAAVDEAVAASLKALGVRAKPQSNEDRVWETYVEAIREAGELVSGAEVARRLGLHQSSVSMICGRLVKDGRMACREGALDGRNAYIPLGVK